jgi:hypothetical protein
VTALFAGGRRLLVRRRALAWPAELVALALFRLRPIEIAGGAVLL